MTLKKPFSPSPQVKLTSQVLYASIFIREVLIIYSRNKQNPNQLLSLNALRGIAFLGIFCEHTALFQAGAWSVSVFFILSGFLMIYNYFDRDIELHPKAILSFTWKKIAKLYPLHILAFIASIPVCNFVFGSAPFIKNSILNILLLQSWFGDSGTYFSFNAVSWYLSTYAFLYVCFPFIHKCIKKYTQTSTAFYSILITFLLQFILAYASTFLPEINSFSDNFSKWFTYIFPIFRLGDLIIGCNLGYLFLNRNNTPSAFYATITESLSFLITGGLLYIYNAKISFGAFEWSRYTLLYTISSILLIYCFALNAGLITKFLTNRIFIYIANYK